jgi:predicted nucleic acid-binding protein
LRQRKDKYRTAKDALEDAAINGVAFFAPDILIAEVLFILCNKYQNGLLTDTQYQDAIEDFRDQMSVIFPAPDGETSLITRAVEIRNGYGCSRSSDSIYIALAEELEKTFMAICCVHRPLKHLVCTAVVSNLNTSSDKH